MDPTVTKLPTSRRWIAAILLAGSALGVRVGFLDTTGFPPDQHYFVDWAFQAQNFGMATVYDRLSDGRSFCNYPPLYIYVLRGLAAVQNRLADPASRLGPETGLAIWSDTRDPSASFAKVLFKLPGVISDCVVVFLLCFWLWPRAGWKLASGVAAGYALSPAVIHDSAVWGQVDGLVTLLMLLSLESARRKDVVWMAAWAALALLMKAQAMMIAPIWAAAIWMIVRRRPVELLKAAGVFLAITVVVLLPFSGALDKIWEGYSRAAKYYPFVHLNGFSAWFIGYPLAAPSLKGVLSDAYVHDNVVGFLGLTARLWGMTGLVILWGRVFLELVRREMDEASLAWAAMALPLGFFLLSTQMHERYLFPAMALWAWAAFPTLRWWILWALLSLCALINQWWVWPGHPDGSFAIMLKGYLHHQWVGMSVSAVLIAILVATILEKRPRQIV